MEQAISDTEFERFKALLHKVAGIHLPSSKKPLVSGRLAKRLRALAIGSFGDYYRLIVSGGESAELRLAIELLTTNETYFFREPAHFEALRERVLPALGSGQAIRVWSAASSSGEEAYSIAMLLMDQLGERHPWEVFASDINTQMIERARRAVYSTERTDGIPRDFLRRYCLRGTGSMNGKLRIDSVVRNKVRFETLNLNGDLRLAGDFDVIFLRNVMIYFDTAMKRRVLLALHRQLRKGGWLFIGHSETLNGVVDCFTPVRPTIYRKDMP